MIQGLNWLTVIKLSGAYLAFLIGSGFATGQEAMQFFVVYGWYGFGGTLVSALLMVYTTASLMKAGKHNPLHTNEDAFRYFCGPILGVLLTWYTMVMIVAVSAVMLAGAAATLNQAYNVPVYAGAGIMAAVVMVTMLLGLKRIVAVIGFIGPLLIILTIAVAFVSLKHNFGQLADGVRLVGDLDILMATPHWLFSGFVYVGLTLPGMASLLPQIGRTTNSNSEISAVALIGPLFFIGAMTLVTAALLSVIVTVHDAEVPVMALAENVFPIYGSIFAIVIFFGIYTTVTPLLWTVCSRFSEENTTRYRVIVLTLTGVSFLGATVLPFGELVNLIYPTIGYVGLLILVSMLMKDIRLGLFARD